MIVQTRGGGEREFRFSLSDMAASGWVPRSVSGVGGVAVTADAVRGVTAYKRAVEVFSGAVASMPVRMFTDSSPRRPVLGSRLARFLSQQPNEQQTRFGFWETLAESLKYRGNAFAWINRDPATDVPVEWYALHPDQVVNAGDGWLVTVDEGYVDPVGRGRARYKVAYSSGVVLHLRGHGDGGKRLAPSPIRASAGALSVAIARQQHEAQSFQAGATIKAAVIFPGKPTTEQKTEWRDSFRQRHVEGGEQVMLLGGGADIKPVGMTMEDAQMVEAHASTLQQCAQIVGVPGEIIEGEWQRGETLEMVLGRWLRFGLSPELGRIEQHLMHHPWLAPPRGQVIAFDSENFVRGDLATEDQITHDQIQDGRLMVDEWRIPRGMPPLPDGLGMIPQVVPVGGGAHGVPLPATPPPVVADDTAA